MFLFPSLLSKEERTLLESAGMISAINSIYVIFRDAKNALI